MNGDDLAVTMIGILAIGLYFAIRITAVIRSGKDKSSDET